MAKQTFTTGQVLTAAQMTSLQQTAMGGGSATAKTASYVLVAADAGTTVAMNAAGATTITVNTGLFAAGDTVFIQNLGAGACTVTAGTATVATAGSLILPQNDAGILYFTSASAAIFYDYIQAGAVSPLTTKGDLYTFSTSDARLGVGANGTTLVADSTEATGLKWAAPAAGSALTFIKSVTVGTNVSSVAVTSAFSATYANYLVVVNGIDAATDDSSLTILFGSVTTGYYGTRFYDKAIDATTVTTRTNNGSSAPCGVISTSDDSGLNMYIYQPNLTKRTLFTSQFAAGQFSGYAGGLITSSNSETDFTLACSSNMTGGTIRVYGIANS